jgi:hypothetical protein
MPKYTVVLSRGRSDDIYVSCGVEGENVRAAVEAACAEVKLADRQDGNRPKRHYPLLVVFEGNCKPVFFGFQR